MNCISYVSSNTFHLALAKFFSICAQTPSLIFLSEAAFPEILTKRKKRVIFFCMDELNKSNNSNYVSEYCTLIFYLFPFFYFLLISFFLLKFYLCNLPFMGNSFLCSQTLILVNIHQRSH